MTRADIEQASRKELVRYLESWGTACYDDEPIDLLRECALENHATEGDGYGPMLCK
jgi:hypothetical protein